MALKDTWVNKKNNEDIVDANDINSIAEAVIEIEKKGTGGEGITKEIDPTVPAWAKKKTKPAYTAEEVGARPDTWMPTAEEVGADAKGAAENKVSNHNTSTTAHNDIRLAFQQLLLKVNNFLDSDDATLDQLSEMIEYIKDNRTLIEGITTKIEKTLTDANKYTDDSLMTFEEGFSEMYMQLLKGLYGDDVWQEFEQTGEFVSIVYLISESLKAHNTNEQAHSDIRKLISNMATGKLDASKLTEAINTALAQAKVSGEFDGATGRRGTGLLPITTAPSAYTTAVNGLTPAYRISLSTVKTQASTTEVYAGDTIQQSYYYYPVIYVDASYVYCGTRESIRGATGSAGKTPVKGTDYFTEDDKTEMVNAVIAALPTTEGVGF